MLTADYEVDVWSNHCATNAGSKETQALNTNAALNNSFCLVVITGVSSCVAAVLCICSLVDIRLTGDS